MGYDIYSHAANQEVSLVLPDCSLDLQQHRAVFASRSVDYSRYPLVTRMADFFSDATFSHDEICDLVSELERLETEFRGLQQEKYVCQIADVCRKAADHGYAVTCLCD